MGAFNSFFKSTHKSCGAGFIIPKAQLCACSAIICGCQTPLCSRAWSTDLVAERSCSTQRHLSAKHDSVCFSSSLLAQHRIGSGCILKNRAAGHWPTRPGFFSCRVRGVLRLTGCLKTACWASHSRPSPSSPPVGDGAEVP